MSYLALFPLRLVAFPGETVHLHIFEPRYRELIHDCDNEGIPFGINVTLDKKLMPIGTELMLERIVRRYPQGEMDVECLALGTYRLNSFDQKAPGKEYAGGNITHIDHENDPDPAKNALLLERVRQLYETIEVEKALPDTAQEFRTFDFAHHVGFSIEQEYEFLTIPQEIMRQERMLRHLESLMPKLDEAREVARRAMMNGHFKNALPPEIE